MSNGNGPQQPQPSKPPVDRSPPKSKQDNRDEVAIASIRFASPTDFKTKPAADGLTAVPREKAVGPDGKRIPGQAQFVITYLPWFRHHRVEYFEPSNAVPVVKYVHEARVKSWEPVTP